MTRQSTLGTFFLAPLGPSIFGLCVFSCSVYRPSFRRPDRRRIPPGGPLSPLGYIENFVFVLFCKLGQFCERGGRTFTWFGKSGSFLNRPTRPWLCSGIDPDIRVQSVIQEQASSHQQHNRAQGPNPTVRNNFVQPHACHIGGSGECFRKKLLFSLSTSPSISRYSP